ncbi:hypothetical protein [Galactobacter valiniphilus]|uniref:hypothetical protein n=1 Tax=Galactobacter valiniphilus TaxID=2676122 RepID=UPI0018F3EFDB|nr:hypothetical protein [Galactobacter valiniphilus]
MPPSFEDLGLGSGLVRYTAHPLLPRGGAPLVLEGLRDLATVRVDGVAVAAFDTEAAASGVELAGEGLFTGA